MKPVFGWREEVSMLFRGLLYLKNDTEFLPCFCYFYAYRQNFYGLNKSVDYLNLCSDSGDDLLSVYRVGRVA